MTTRAISQALSLSFVRRGIIAILVPACIFQCLFVICDLDRFLSVFYCVAGTLLLLTVFDRKTLAKNPLSSLVVMGFGFTHFFFPIVFTSIMGRSVAYRMNIPHVVFGWALMTFGFVVLFHKLYCNADFIQKPRIEIQKRVFTPAGLFTPPKNSQLWIMGSLGLFAMYLDVSGGGNVPEIMMKVVNGFNPFSFAPFFLLIQPGWGPQKNLKSGNIVALACFTAIMFFIAMASGRRGYVVLGFVNAGLIYFLSLCTGALAKPKVRPVLLVVGTILCLIFIPLLLQAFRAAQISRHGSSVSLSQRFAQFWIAFQDSQSSRDHHEAVEALTLKYGLWDEDYSGNEFFNRLSNPRVHDNLMSAVFELQEADLVSVQELDYRRALATLPSPVLKSLGVSIDKEKTIGGSVADYIWILRNNTPWTFGEFKAGSLIASTYCYVGSFFPVVIAAMAVPVFFLSDLLALRVRVARNEFKTIIPLIGYLQGYSFFSTFSTSTTMESPGALLGALTRGFLQAMVLYWVVFHLTALPRRHPTKK